MNIPNNMPLVSYCLFTYNQEPYVRASLEAALAQDYSPLEIVISDDCSSDGTVDVIRDVIADYAGPHRIVLNVNKENLGIGAHFSKVFLELTSGDYVITVGGDDISFVNHVQLAVQEIEKLQSVQVVDFSASIIDASGMCMRDTNALESPVVYRLDDYIRMKQSICIFAPGRIISRKLINAYGSINSDCPTEDTVILLRALLFGGLKRVPLTVIDYRRTANSASARSSLMLMDNEGIVRQYLGDVNQAYGSRFIDRSTARWLKRRLRLERIVRNSRYRFDSGTINYYTYRMLAKLMVVGFSIIVIFRFKRFYTIFDKQ